MIFLRRLSCAFHRSLLQSTGIIVFVQSMPSCCPSKPHKLGFTAVLAVPDFGVRIFLSVVLVMLFQISGEHCDNPLKSTFCENHKWFCYFILFFVLSIGFVCLFLLCFSWCCWKYLNQFTNFLKKAQYMKIIQHH